jgi:hypothetical protein
METMMREVAERVDGVRVPATGHWIAEENSSFLVAELVRFFGSSPR